MHAQLMVEHSLIRSLRSEQCDEGKRQRLRDGGHAAVVGREANVQAAPAQEFERGQMQRIRSAHGLGERLERSSKDQRG